MEDPYWDKMEEEEEEEEDAFLIFRFYRCFCRMVIAIWVVCNGNGWQSKIQVVGSMHVPTLSDLG